MTKDSFNIVAIDIVTEITRHKTIDL